MSERRAAVNLQSEMGADGSATLTFMAPVLEAQRGGAVEALGAALGGYCAAVVPAARGLTVTVECRIEDARAVQDLVYNTVFAFLAKGGRAPL